MSEETWKKGSMHVRTKAAESIKKLLRAYSLDVIMSPADARMASVAAAAGFPVATVPLGYADFNGRAFGMHLMASPGSERRMLEVMNAWEASFPNIRQPPPLIKHWDDFIFKTVARM